MRTTSGVVMLLALSLSGVGCHSERGATGTAEPGAPLAGLRHEEIARFAEGRTVFNRGFSPEEGLGPLFNQDRCSSCHDIPTSGGTGVETALKVTRFVPPSGCDLLVNEGGPIIQLRTTPLLKGLGVQREAEPSSATARANLTAPLLYGLGLVEAIPVQSILRREDPDDADGDGISGRAGRAADGRVARFGQKAEFATVLDFVDNALRTELGLTTFLHPTEETINGKPVPAQADPAPDPEVDRRTLELLTDYVRFLAPPTPMVPSSAAERDSLRRGERVFRKVGCAACHVPVMRTGRRETRALDRQTVRLYSDLLLHDLGPEVAGICGVAAAPSEIRTARLAGLHHRHDFMHAAAASPRGAIMLHGGEAARSRDAFIGLSGAAQAYLLRFLDSL